MTILIPNVCKCDEDTTTDVLGGRIWKKLGLALMGPPFSCNNLNSWIRGERSEKRVQQIVENCLWKIGTTFPNTISLCVPKFSTKAQC